jgi:hypothetical protein
MKAGDVFNLVLCKNGRWACVIWREGVEIMHEEMCDEKMQRGLHDASMAPTEIERALSTFLRNAEEYRRVPIFTRLHFAPFLRLSPEDSVASNNFFLYIANGLARHHAMLGSTPASSSRFETATRSAISLGGVLVDICDIDHC